MLHAQGRCPGGVKFSRWLRVQRMEAVLVSAVVLALQTVNVQELFVHTLSRLVRLSLKK